MPFCTYQSKTSQHGSTRVIKLDRSISIRSNRHYLTACLGSEYALVVDRVTCLHMVYVAAPAAWPTTSYHISQNWPWKRCGIHSHYCDMITWCMLPYHMPKCDSMVGGGSAKLSTTRSDMPAAGGRQLILSRTMSNVERSYCATSMIHSKEPRTDVDTPMVSGHHAAAPGAKRSQMDSRWRT